MSDKQLTVAALRTTVEAELIRSKLEKAGIAAALLEPGPQPEGATAARVQVQVGPADFERAMQLLFPIPQRSRPAKSETPGWKCPKCGEQVVGQFPVCWKCGTTREGLAPPGGMSFPSAAAGAPPPPFPSFSPGPTASPAVSPTVGRTAPPPPMSPSPSPAFPGPQLEARPKISMPAGAASPPLEIPPIPAAPGTAPHKPAVNGESPLKPAVVPAGRTRTAEEEGLTIVVPAWDAATARGKGRQSSQRLPTEADDRAARRAWWTAVLGIICWPLLIYSIGVVLLLGLTGRELSRRGTRFFYGALIVNAVIIGIAFAWLGMHR